MQILDTHVHLWDPRNTPRAVTPLVRLLGFSPRLIDWVARRLFPRDVTAFYATPKHVTRAYLPADFDADRAHQPVRGLVHIEAGWTDKGPAGPVGETRWLDDLSPSGAGRVQAIIVHVDLTQPDVADVLDAHLDASDRVRGARDVLAWHPSKRIMSSAAAPHLTSDPQWRAGFEQVVQRGLSFEATCYNTQLAELAALARAYPEQSMMLCHLGTPIGVAGPFGGVGNTAAERDVIVGSWKVAMARLAECANVHVKLSGLGMPICGFGFEQRETPPTAAEVADAFEPLVSFAIKTFGVRRCMFGSNFPIDKVSMPYSVLVEAMLAITASYTEDEQRQLFEGNGLRYYRVGTRRSG